MTKSKYQKDANGNSILGEQHGITITRPWSQEMYEHNEKIADQMKDQIQKAIDKALAESDESSMRIIGTALNAYGYGHGMDFEDIHEDCERGLSNVQNHWLHSDTWPDLLKAGLVQPLETGFVGYDKIK